jgi:hypothetical protein
MSFLDKILDAVTGRDRQEPDVLPASQDPYGDPADQGMNAGYNPGEVLPASQDPYGDPADQGTNAGYDQGDVLPASQDPYGDPADEEPQPVRGGWPF